MLHSHSIRSQHKQISAPLLVQEHEIYPEAVAALVEGRISWRQDGVPVIWSPS